MTDETAKELVAALRQLAETIDRAKHYQPQQWPPYQQPIPMPSLNDPLAPYATWVVPLATWGLNQTGAGNYS